MKAVFTISRKEAIFDEFMEIGSNKYTVVILLFYKAIVLVFECYHSKEGKGRL